MLDCGGFIHLRPGLARQVLSPCVPWVNEVVYFFASGQNLTLLPVGRVMFRSVAGVVVL